jgi:hypothetical protein
MSNPTTVQEFPSHFANVAVAVLSLGLVIGILNKLVV